MVKNGNSRRINPVRQEIHPQIHNTKFTLIDHKTIGLGTPTLMWQSKKGKYY